MRRGTKAAGLLASFAAGIGLALGGCGDDDPDPAATTGQRGENTATIAPEDTTTGQSVTETGLTATTGETETTETDGEDDSGSGGGDDDE